MCSDFYRSFEDRHRGPRELIKLRLQVYRPFIDPLKEIYEQPSAVDLGCGRGEWLELLRDAGFIAVGVDLDEGMLECCRILGLDVQKQDVIAKLKMLPSSSQALVTGFHLAEHLPFSDLQILVQEVFRVLQPAGLLILETPNSENILVGASNFYVDPTHQRPLPPPLLSFLPEYYGFGRIKIVRLQEDPKLANKARLSFYDVLSGVSPDYAVVAQKSGDQSNMKLSDFAFDREYGPDLNVIAERLDKQTEHEFFRLEALSEQVREIEFSVSQACGLAEQTRQLAVEAVTESEQARERADYAVAASEQARQDVSRSESMLNSVLQSRSWRVTKPLRWLGQHARRLRDYRLMVKGASTGERIWRTVLERGVIFVEAHPRSRIKVIDWAKRFSVYEELRSIYWRATGAVHGEIGKALGAGDDMRDVLAIPPRARRIYLDLVVAMENDSRNER